MTDDREALIKRIFEDPTLPPCQEHSMAGRHGGGGASAERFIVHNGDFMYTRERWTPAGMSGPYREGWTLSAHTIAMNDALARAVADTTNDTERYVLTSDWGAELDPPVHAHQWMGNRRVRTSDAVDLRVVPLPGAVSVMGALTGKVHA